MSFSDDFFLREKKILRRWKEETSQNGSMENALNRVSDRYIKKNSFLLSVMSEFKVRNETLKIEKHLISFYDTFPASERERVDWRQILCTYLSLVWKNTVIHNPRKLFFQFYDIFMNLSGTITLKELIEIVSVGAVDCIHFSETSERLKQCLFELFPNCNERSISKRILHDLFDVNPVILIQFRDQIMSNIANRDLLAELAADSFQSRADKIMMVKALRFWDARLLESFKTWANYRYEKNKRKEIAMRMMYWKILASLQYWRWSASVSLKLKKKCDIAVSMCNTRRAGRFFNLWLRHVKIQHKIKNCCHRISDSFQSLQLGLGLLGGTWLKCKRRQLLLDWYAEIKLRETIELAAHWSTTKAMHRHLLAWKKVTLMMKEILKHEEDSQKQQSWMLNFIHDMEKEMDEDKAKHKALEERHLDKELCLARSREQALQRRNTYNILSERKILQNQYHLRRERVQKQNMVIINKWKAKWAHEEEKRIELCIKQTKNWLEASQDAKHVLLKNLKKLEREFHTGPSEFYGEREKELSSLAYISLAILDGKMASAGFLPEEFLEGLQNQHKDKKMHFTDFESAIGDIGIRTNVSVRDAFDDFEFSNNKERDIFDYLKARFAKFDGSRWKQYVSPAHNVMIIHDCVEDKKMLEHEVTKRHLKLIVKENYIAREVKRERQRIFKDKKNDLQLMLKDSAAKTMQQMLRRSRARKKMAKNRWRIDREEIKSERGGNLFENIVGPHNQNKQSLE